MNTDGVARYVKGSVNSSGSDDNHKRWGLANKLATPRQAAMPGTSHPPKLAKLTRPQASNAVLRHRLFTRLDEAQERPIVWIHGPPGAGKSYLSAKKRSGIWYQIDSDDGDPASLFYYLGLAAIAEAPRKRRPMPLLTPEYLLDVEGFTRRFFRELF